MMQPWALHLNAFFSQHIDMYMYSMYNINDTDLFNLRSWSGAETSYSGPL